ncbi:MAG: LysR family transcriptional regulator [Neisseriaceae bacterium]|nr:MAG: LysR family transcriptional regulator [Neisseriaceae bacterium]
MLKKRAAMLDDIALFIKLCEARSVKLCAELNHIHTSTISKRISELELSLGKRLVIRTSKRFELTDFGNYIYTGCKHIPLFVDSIINTYDNKHQSKNVSGTINVALGSVISNKLICPYLYKFLQLYPSINLNLNFYPSIQTWLSPQFDLILAINHIKGDDLENRFIRHEYIRLFCNSEYAIRYGLPQSIEELSKHNIIGFVDPDYIPLDYAKLRHKNTNDEYVLNLTGNRLNVSNNIHTVQIGLNADYIFGAYESLVQDEVRNGTLLPVLPDWYAFELDFYLVSKKKFSQETQLFIDFIYDCMRNTPYGDTIKSS